MSLSARASKARRIRALAASSPEAMTAVLSAAGAAVRAGEAVRVTAVQSMTVVGGPKSGECQCFM